MRLSNAGPATAEEKAIDYNVINRVSQQGNAADYLTARIARDRPDVLDLLDQVTVGKQGERTDLVYNVNKVGIEERPAGNARQYALRRLRKSRLSLGIWQHEETPD